MFVGVTACGKTEFLLQLLETVYKNHFEFIMILCPTILDNKTYLLENGSLMIRTFSLCVMLKEDQMNGLNYSKTH